MKIKLSQLRQLIKEQVEESENKEFKAKEKRISDRVERLFKKLVPNSGSAQTIEGEMIRAINRIWYRYFNDGDYWYRGYGKETALPSVKWLKTQSPVAKELKGVLKVFSRAQSPEHHEYGANDLYFQSILKASEIICNYVEKQKEYTPNTDHDSRH